LADRDGRGDETQMRHASTMNTSKPGNSSPSVWPLSLSGRAQEFEINETKRRIGNPGKICDRRHPRISTMGHRTHANEAKDAQIGKSLRIMTAGFTSERSIIGCMYPCWWCGPSHIAETEQTKPRMRGLGKVCGLLHGEASSGLRIGVNEARNAQDAVSLMIVVYRKN
jgi:hypothetical protein